jgi:MOSC domain-containing protein YiiM
VVDAAELEEATYAMARRIAANAPLSISVMKEQLRILAGAHTMSPEDFERIQGLRRVVYNSQDYAEGIRAFKEKRKPVFRGMNRPCEAKTPMARITLFTGGIQPLPESGRPTGMYKTRVDAPIALARGFCRRPAGRPARPWRPRQGCISTRPDTTHVSPTASRGGGAARARRPGREPVHPDLDEADVRVGDLWQLGSAVLQVSQPRSPCWKIDERFAAEGMAGFIAEHLLTGWYWRVVNPATWPRATPWTCCTPQPIPRPCAKPSAVAGPRPAVADLERLADLPGWPAPGRTRSCSASPG